MQSEVTGADLRESAQLKQLTFHHICIWQVTNQPFREIRWGYYEDSNIPKGHSVADV